MVVDAESAVAAAKLVYEGCGFAWEMRSVVELDARLVVTLDDEGEEFDSTACGDF